MKKPSSVFASNHEYILKPFALQNHEHENYFQLDSTSPVEVDSPVIFNGPVYGIPGLSDPVGVTDGFVLTADAEKAVWAAPTGWGDIGGTLSDQTDLQAALDLKSDTTHTHAYEPSDATILKDADIGSTVQAYDAQTSKTDVAETRSASINMADNVLQRPELKDYSETSVVANTGTSYAINLANGNVFQLGLTGNVTYTFTNPPPTTKAGSFTLIQIQDATGGRTVTWPASVKWPGGVAPVISSGATDIDIFTFLTRDAGTTWYGFTGGMDFS